MVDTVTKTITDNVLLQNGDHVLVAVSGGSDSVALLRIFEILLSEYSLKITVAHLNHGLRGEEADREEDFVRILSQKMDVAFVSKKIDLLNHKGINGKSIEETCREERYRFLYETADRIGATKIATGHHRNDLAETFLINLFRGAGMEGLRGIAPIRNDRLIRPLLNVGREEILHFLHAEGLSFMTDSSNSDQTFLRNSIRGWLLPELERRYNPRLVQAIVRTSQIIRCEDDYMQGVVRRLTDGWRVKESNGDVVVPLPELLKQHPAVQSRIIKFLLEGMTSSNNGIAYRHVESALALSRRNDSALSSIDLPAGIVVVKRASSLIIRKTSRNRNNRSCGVTCTGDRRNFEIAAEIPDVIEIPAIRRSIRLEFVDVPQLAEVKQLPETAFIDYDCLRGPLHVRNWRHGDWIDFLGLGGTKKLKDYFIDRKIPGHLRGSIPLLVDAHSVIWIAGARISHRVRITANTKKVLKIELL